MGDQCENALTSIKKKFDTLPKPAKVGVGAAAGFVGSRFALRTVVTTAKIAGAAFVVSEVMHITGVAEEVPSFINEENAEKVKQIKDKVVKQANGVRMQVRRQLNPSNVKQMVENERETALGFAGGALLGFVL